MENRQINFFKSKDLNTVLKPFKKGTVVKIDSFDIRENQNELKIGLFGWYAICPSNELKKNKLFYFSLYDEPLVLYRDENENVRCIKNINSLYYLCIFISCILYLLRFFQIFYVINSIINIFVEITLA